ncbi:SDR family oxidoreductase [Actinobacteria bacterium YIM 96077]|uniref:Oxidoreductase n=1 Tax=Phytoactinopolyspora halophila TaxID=1981511 RepID=A0A329QV60_9ACTN|nr:SDR family oxidoreductase [Phytoactinopolyspora halophila]AYY12882.1 SDR family oxidoreductase [Actinobacteria bacterium YIM 96077]RAW16324.1 oxidoreductase [Phytoactinopolyspora halophila]
MPDLTGKVAVVTGGSRGIGAAIASRLAEDGADVVVTYRSRADEAATVVEKIESGGRRALALAADSADPQAVTWVIDETVRQLGRLDILVANAGVFPMGPLEEVTLDEVDSTLAVHVRGVFLAAQAAAAHMGDGGRIISIGSCLAERVPVAGITLYSMSKSALTGLTKGLARDLGPRGITANVVHPGPTDTDMNPADSDEAADERALTALGRYGTPADVAGMVSYLAGGDGAWVTGASFAVDGGYGA